MRRFYGLITLAVTAFLLVGVTAKSSMQATQPPTPTAICAPAPPSRLIVRERARVSLADPRPLNMRDGPGTAHPVIAQIPASSVVYVLDGPQCGQNYAWYKVEFEGQAGWIAEGDDRAYFVEVYPPG